MFPEYRELISQLKTTDHHFRTLFDRHNALDQKIKNMESHIEPGTHEEIETHKKEKLRRPRRPSRRPVPLGLRPGAVPFSSSPAAASRCP